MPCPRLKNVSQMHCKCHAGEVFYCSAKFANRSHTPTMARDWWLKASIFGTSPHRHGCTRIPTPQERCTRISTPLERCIRISTLLGLHEDSRERCTTTTEISRLHLTCCLILPRLVSLSKARCVKKIVKLVCTVIDTSNHWFHGIWRSCIQSIYFYWLMI